MNEIAGKVCLVTGASRGIGAAVARGLGARGAKVMVHYRSGRAQAEAVAADIEQQGGTARIVEGDIALPGTAERLIQETVETFGRLDVLINNAGDQISRVGIAEFPDELFERHLAINVRPVFVACRAAVRQFRSQKSGGNIINVCSVAARTGGGQGSAVYAGAKAFMSTFSRSIAKEVAPEGIRVNVVSPGVIKTDLQDRVTSPEQLKATATQIPMARIGDPEDCVGTFLYLCSDQLSGYVTGQVVEVNGGLLMP
ncbi:glucose 1-dehydrogenase [Paraburkholderia sp.]|uniref:SDR family NAD(P)-dependent oxidoreductase n=1 Tax=Paraburkholderia sp. TaxID=1926495 RepID=UPI002B0029B4|nr:glucose 1-dehydrogenase [Paraburkholderia sp.]